MSARALCIMLAAQAGGGGTLEWAHVLQSVKAHLPLVLAAQEDARAAAARLNSARGGFDPVLRGRAAVTPWGDYPSQAVDAWVEQPTPVLGTTFYGGWRVGRGAFAVYDQKQGTGTLGEIRGGVRVPLGRHLLMDPRRAALERANGDKMAQEAGLQVALLEGGAAAGQAWLNWVAAGQRHAVQQDMLELAHARQQGLEQRVLMGDLPRMEAEENRRAVLVREAQVVAARRALDQAAISLSLYARDTLGVPRVPEQTQLPASMPTPSVAMPVEDSVRRAMARRPDLTRQRYLEAQARVDVKLTEQELLPVVDLWVQGSQDLGAGSRTRPELTGLLTVEIPLPSRVARGRLEANEAAVRKLRHQSRWIEERIQADVRDVHNALGAASLRVGLARLEVAVAAKLAQAEWRRFDVGEGTLLLVNLREQAAVEARLRLVDAEADAWRAQLAFQTATAQLFD